MPFSSQLNLRPPAPRAQGETKANTVVRQGLSSRTSKGETKKGRSARTSKRAGHPRRPRCARSRKNYEGRSDVTGPLLCSSKGDATEGAAQGGAKTLQYREVVPPGTLRAYVWELKLKSEVIIGDFRPNAKRVNAARDKKRMFVYEVIVKRNPLMREECKMLW